MARYQLPAPQSMYRDTGAVEITKLLRDRYVQNLAADDALAQAILEMDSLGADDETKQALIQKYNTQLNQRAEQGNYEMKGVAIQKDARAFTNDYQPIKVSKMRYDTYAAQLEKDYQDGKIDSQTKDGRLAESLYNYKGVQYREDGSVDDDSLFNGSSYVHDVNVEEEIIKHMKDVVMTEIDSTGMEFPLDAEMNIITKLDPATQSPAYYMKSGTYEKKLDEDLVSSVVNSVLNQPNVSSSIYQKAHLENYALADINTETGNTKAFDKLAQIVSVIEAETEKLEDKKDLSDAEEIKLEKNIAVLDTIEEAKARGVNDVALVTLLANDAKRYYYLDNAITKYAGVKSKKAVQDFTEGSSLKAANDPNRVPTNISYRVGVKGLVVDVLGGTTLEEKQKLVANSNNDLNKFRNDPKKGPQFIADALNASSAEDYDDMTIKYGLSADRARALSRQVQYDTRLIELASIQESEAYQAAFNMSKDDYTVQMNNLFSNVRRGGDFTGGDVSVSDLIKTLNTVEGGNYTVSSGLEELNSNKALLKKVIDSLTTQRQDNIDRSRMTIPDLTRNLYSSTNSILREFDKKVGKDKKKINDYLDAEIPTDAIVMPSFSDPTGKTAKNIKSIFKEGLPGGDKMEVITPDDKVIKSSEIKDDMDLGKRDENPELVLDQIGLVHVARPDGKALIALPYKHPKTGDIKIYYVDATNIVGSEGSALNNYTSSMQFRVRSMYRQGIWANVRSWSPEIFGGSVTFVYYDSDEAKEAGKSANKIFIGDTEYDLEDGLKEIEGSLIKNGQDI